MIWPCPESGLGIAKEGLWELVQWAPGSSPDLPHHSLEGSRNPSVFHSSLPACSVAFSTAQKAKLKSSASLSALVSTATTSLPTSSLSSLPSQDSVLARQMVTAPMNSPQGPRSYHFSPELNCLRFQLSKADTFPE